MLEIQFSVWLQFLEGRKAVRARHSHTVFDMAVILAMINLHDWSVF